MTMGNCDDFWIPNGDINMDRGHLITVLSTCEHSAKFLTRKIHKIKKILRFLSKKRGTQSSTTAAKPSLEEEQNAANERLSNDCDLGSLRQIENENFANESWEKWDACYSSVAKKEEMLQSKWDEHENLRPYFPSNLLVRSSSSRYNSVCYVFMPDQTEPVAVKLRTARIPGGVLCVTYRPDEDIRSNKNDDAVCSFTSFQRPQAQQAPLRPLIV